MGKAEKHNGQISDLGLMVSNLSGQEGALFVLPSCSINTLLNFSRGGLSGNFCNTKKNEFYRVPFTTKRSSLRFSKCQVSNSAGKSWFRRLQL